MEGLLKGLLEFMRDMFNILWQATIRSSSFHSFILLIIIQHYANYIGQRWFIFPWKAKKFNMLLKMCYNYRGTTVVCQLISNESTFLIGKNKTNFIFCGNELMEIQAVNCAKLLIFPP